MGSQGQECRDPLSQLRFFDHSDRAHVRESWSVGGIALNVCRTSERCIVYRRFSLKNSGERIIVESTLSSP